MKTSKTFNNLQSAFRAVAGLEELNIKWTLEQVSTASQSKTVYLLSFEVKSTEIPNYTNVMASSDDTKAEAIRKNRPKMKNTTEKTAETKDVSTKQNLDNTTIAYMVEAMGNTFERFRKAL